uniref:Ig-like domain-containing protein n=1 Tax=Astatotilapia calliptera TaxID=8154 RepID=A0AAX7SUI8_ASTCA
MLFLPAAALCCLCSVGENVSFSCGGTEQCDSRAPYVLWYQKKEKETFKVILDIHKTNGDIDKRYGHPQKDDFSVVNKQNSCELKIEKVKPDHSATYYCSCYKLAPHSEK